MVALRTTLILGAALGLQIGCGGRRTEPVNSTGPSEAHDTQGGSVTTAQGGGETGAPPAEEASSQVSAVDVNREIVPLLDPIPAPITDGEKLSEDPRLIRKEAARLLADGNSAEALPLIDVLLILDPNDLEMLETRGRILLGEGFREDAAVDLERCCREGRSSCCR